MEAKCAAIWGPVDASGEESEVIAHLQSMFWSSSNVAANPCSPNTSVSSCVTASTTVPSSLLLPLVDGESYGASPLANTGMDMCFDHQHQSLTPTSRASTGDKRAFAMDEQRRKSKNASKKSRSAPRALSSSVIADETNADPVHLSCCCCCCSCWSSEEDSIRTSDKSVVLKQSVDSKGCKRSSSNSQSLYAKKRRERINERLRTLQQLIPNGTKVDISTMLQEAVQYVKFLQLQIKLLSSDETWMYAPLAYTGLNIDLSLSTAAEQE